MTNLINDFVTFWRLDDRDVQDRVILALAVFALIVVVVS